MAQTAVQYIEGETLEPVNFANPHWETLTSTTQQAFHIIENIDLIQQFYLAGGTGAALHLGHRFSLDLDFFSVNPDSLGPGDRAKILGHLDQTRLTITHDKDGTLVAAWQGVGLSFSRLDQYPLALPTMALGKIQDASLKEIGAMKLAAIFGRGSRKDFVDLYFILQQVTLEELFRIAALKYAKVRSFATSAVRGLAYFEDAEKQPMPEMLDHTPWSKMKGFLEKQATQAGRSHLEDLWV